MDTAYRKGSVNYRSGRKSSLSTTT